jgi:uncharacterized protein (DUF885 family)
MRPVAPVVFVGVLACAGPTPDQGPGVAAALRTELIDEIGEAHRQLELDEYLWLQVKHGVETTRLPDVGVAHAEQRSRDAAELLERLAGLDEAELDSGEWVTLESLRWDLGMIAEEARHYWQWFRITPYTLNWYGVHMLFQSLEISAPADAERYLDLARQYAVFVDDLRAKLEGQEQRGIVLPRDEIALILPSWRRLVESPGDVFPALDDPPLEAPETFPEELSRIVEAEVQPAWERLIGFLDGPYRERAPTAIGLAQYPGGSELYDYLVRWSTTLEASPEEIHRLGLERIAAVDERMSEIRRRLGFEGSRLDFRRKLDADPRFYAATPQEVEDRLLAHVAAIEPEVDAFFSHFPEAPYRLQRLGPELEGSMTYGYYQEPTTAESHGTYFYNGSRLEERSLIGAAALIYHELIPGHHFQVALQSENRDLPAYRGDSWHDGFGEGWAEYASMLAEEMGMYRDPYDLYGRLAEESFMAARLVVDTGMNRLGWSRERASAFMREHTVASETEIATETLRYAVDMPGQALSYALGALEIRALRERARQQLGQRFDIRRFHAAVLEHGSMPLAVLGRHIDRFIEEESRR